MIKKLLTLTALKMEKKLATSPNYIQQVAESSRVDQSSPEPALNSKISSQDSKVTDDNLLSQPESANPESQNSLHRDNNINEFALNANDVGLTELVNRLRYSLQVVENKLYNAEVRINKLEQYTRRENLEISGIPDSIIQNNLEVTVLKILESIGVQTDSYHISACHRLAKNKNQQSANTIIRFTDRKLIYDIFSKKKNLKLSPMKEELGSDLFITENLSPEFKKIYETCKYLKRKNVIHSCWSYNGVIKIKIDNENDRPLKIFHYDDICHYVIDAYKFI